MFNFKKKKADTTKVCGFLDVNGKFYVDEKERDVADLRIESEKLKNCCIKHLNKYLIDKRDDLDYYLTRLTESFPNHTLQEVFSILKTYEELQTELREKFNKKWI